MRQFLKALFCTLVLAAPAAFAQDPDQAGAIPDDTVNQSVTKLEDVAAAPSIPSWKMSLTSLYIDMTGTRNANNDLYGFGEIVVKMQIFNAQYQFNNGWSLSVLAPYIENNVETHLGGTFFDTTKGFGDTSVLLMTPAKMAGNFLFLGGVGANLPTGSIDQRSPYAPNTNYAYNMQLGSGTVDGLVDGLAMFIQPYMQVGGHLNAILREQNGNNNDGYRLGNQYLADLWVDGPTKAGFTPRVVGQYKYRDGLTGTDYTYTRNIYDEYYYHTQVNWYAAAALKYQHSLGSHVGLAAEVGIPFAQDCLNSDNVVVSTLYYGSLTLNGSF